MVIKYLLYNWIKRIPLTTTHRIIIKPKKIKQVDEDYEKKSSEKNWKIIIPYDSANHMLPLLLRFKWNFER